MISSEGVSVIIPNWNHEFFLPRSISSALETVRQLSTQGIDGEVVVVDDHSRDGSSTLLRQLEAMYYCAGLRVFLQPRNMGLGHVRNKALELARYRYIAVLDADNELIPENIHQFVKAIRETDAAIVFGNLITVSGNETGVRGNQYFDHEIFEKNYIDACALVNRDQLIQMGGYVTDAALFGYEDWEMNLHLASNGRKVIHMPLEFGRYYRLPESMIRGADINAHDSSGLSALTFAAENGHIGITALLLERGANVHDRTRAGWDSLMIASRYGITDMVEQLLYRHANPKASDKHLRTALMQAAKCAAPPSRRSSRSTEVMTT